MPALDIETASKRHGDTAALDAVSINFPEGLITAVIGPSGCGKSTLLRLCNGLVRPDSGRDRLLGEPVDYANLPPLRRRLGYAVQGNGLFPHLTARDNISLLARLEHWEQAQIDTRLQELLDLTHLEPKLLDSYPHQLSGGQQQRVGLCRAMMLRPEILLLDEPFAAIDPITRRDIHHQLLELHAADPRTTVLVTHAMDEALRLAEHIVIMGSGQVLLSESTGALLERHPADDPQDLLHALLHDAGSTA